MPDLKQSVAFYVDILGFQITAKPPGWVFLARGDCKIRLGECPDDLHPSKLGSHSYFAYWMVDNLDDWYARLQRSKATLLSEPTDQPWNMREFGFETPDGHRIMLGQSLDAPAA